jgi:hypothetical protein
VTSGDATLVKKHMVAFSVMKSPKIDGAKVEHWSGML